jgi:hypothetical protein
LDDINKIMELKYPNFLLIKQLKNIHKRLKNTKTMKNYLFILLISFFAKSTNLSAIPFDLFISTLSFNGNYGIDPTNPQNDAANFTASICFNNSSITMKTQFPADMRLTGYFSNDNKHTTGDGDIKIGDIDVKTFIGTAFINLNN